jgi:hypothetical protein
MAPNCGLGFLPPGRLTNHGAERTRVENDLPLNYSELAKRNVRLAQDIARVEERLRIQGQLEKAQTDGT